MKRIAIALVALLALSMMLLAGCGEAATTTTAPTTGPSVTTAPQETTTSEMSTTTVSTWPTALQTIIDAAAKEGEVNFFCGNHEYDGAKIAAGVKALFGVDLKINVVPGDQRKILSTVAMEMQSGAVPSYDLMEAAGTNILSTMAPQNMLAQIDWPTLLVSPMDAAAYLPPPAGYVTTIGYVQVLAYDSSKTKPEDLPKSLKDLTDPKYSGKFGWVSYSSANAEILYWLKMTGDDGLTFLTNLVKNKPVIAGYSDLADKLALGELDFVLIGSQEYNNLVKKDAKYQAITPGDYCLVTENSDVVLNKAKNANAATLVELWMTTPEGKAYMLSTGFGNYLDSNTNEYKWIQEAKANNVPVVYSQRDPDFNKWLGSDDCKTLMGKIDAIMKGAAKK